MSTGFGVPTTGRAGPRHAALAVHAMAAADRDWLLARLGPQARAQLQELLQELCVMAIAPQPEWLEGLVAAPAPAPVVGDEYARLRGARPAEVARVLEAEPETVVAEVLGFEPWPWRDAVLLQLPIATRARLQDTDAWIRSRAQAPRGLQEVLVRSLQQRLLDGPPPDLQPAAARHAPSRRGPGEILAHLRRRLRREARA